MVLRDVACRLYGLVILARLRGGAKPEVRARAEVAAEEAGGGFSVDGLLGFVHPAFDDVFGLWEEVVGGDEGGGGDGWVFVDDGGFEETFDTLRH